MQGTIAPAQSRLKIEEWRSGEGPSKQLEDLRELCALAGEEQVGHQLAGSGSKSLRRNRWLLSNFWGEGQYLEAIARERS